ncbi:MAG: hypothetical protein QOE33_2825 [Acidobacteriota bacterium]|nr:hypothetical protein [Acidobacteriota bacterium]
MIKPIRFFFLLATLFACCAASQAQARRTPPPRRGPSPVRASTIGPPSLRPKWQIQTQTYSEDEQATTMVSLQPFPVGVPVGARYTLSFGINYSYMNNDPTHVMNIALNFFSRAPACHFPPQSIISFRIDNLTAILPYQPNVKGADGVFWVSSDTEAGNGCNDSLGAFISRVTLTKLASARSLTGKVGDAAFQFTADDFGALRDLINHLTPPHISPPPPPLPVRH